MCRIEKTETSESRNSQLSFVNMSDNEDLLGDDLGDTLHEYSLGNEDEDLLLAGDEYVFEDKNNAQSGSNYVDEDNLLDEDISDNNYVTSVNNDNVYQNKCVLENITVEVKNQTFVSDTTDVRQRRRSSSSNAGDISGAKLTRNLDVNAAPFITASQVVQPQRDIVDSGKGRLEVRFHSEKPSITQKTPQVRNIPDSLDQVYIPGARGLGVRPRAPVRQTSWRNPHYQQPLRPNLYKKVINNTGPVLPTPQTGPSDPPPQNSPTVSPTQQNQTPTINTPQVSPPRQNHTQSHKNEPEFTQNMQHTTIYHNEPPKYPTNEMALLPRHGFQPQNNMIRNQMPPNLIVRTQIPQITFQNPQVRPMNEIPYFSGPPPQISPHFQNVQFQRFPPPQYTQRPPPFNQMGPRGPNMPPSGPNMGPRGPNMPLSVPIMNPRVPNMAMSGPNMGPRGLNMGPRGPNMVRLPPNMGPVGPMPPIMRNVMPNNQNLGGLAIKNEFGRSDSVIDGPPGVDNLEFRGPLRKQEVRMVPLQQLGVPPAAFAGKKVHINPHFKGNIQPRIDAPLGPPTYVPTRIERPASPLPPYGRPIADVDDAAERFIAEQRSALAKAAARKLQPRRSPQRYIDNTTIEIENELAGPSTNPPPPGDEEQDLLRRQEEFIHANRAGLRRRMRTPSPARRRSPSPPRRRSPSPSWRRRPPLLPPTAPPAAPAPPYKRRREADTTQPDPEESEYRRKLREQENLRERVMRAKEARRLKNAVVLQKQIDDREREKLDKNRQEYSEANAIQNQQTNSSTQPQVNTRNEAKTTTRGTSPTAAPRKEDISRKNVVKAKEAVKPTQQIQTQTSTRSKPSEVKEQESVDDDDALDLFLEELDGVMSEDEQREESGRFKVNDKISAKSTKPISDLRSKLPPRAQSSSDQSKAQAQKQAQNPAQAQERKKIVFAKPREERRKQVEPQPQTAAQKRKMAPQVATTNTTSERSLTPPIDERKFPKQGKITSQTENNAPKPDVENNQPRSRFDRQRITFGNKEVNDNSESVPQAVQETVTAKSSSGSSNRRVVLQRSANKTEEKAKPVETRLEKLSKTSVFQRMDNVPSESNVTRDPTKPTAGIFSRAMRTAIGASTSQTVSQTNRLVVKKRKEMTPEPIPTDNEPKVEFASDTSDEDLDSLNEELLLRDDDEDILNEEISKDQRKNAAPERKNAATDRKNAVTDRKNAAPERKKVESDRFSVIVENLPYGMTETRLSTLAGSDAQSVSIDKERRSARVRFRATDAAKTFVKKFNNKMVAASRLSVTMS